MDDGILVTIITAAICIAISIVLTVITWSNRKKLDRVASELQRTLDSYDKYGLSMPLYGYIDPSDVKRMFKGSTTVDLMYLTGFNFIKYYEKEIKEACEREDCNIRILLAMPGNEFIRDLDRMDGMMNKDRNHSEELPETIGIINAINSSPDVRNRIELRFYSTMFRVSITMGHYKEGDAEAWISIFTPPDVAIKSLMLRAVKGKGENNDMDQLTRFEGHFKMVWDHFSEEAAMDEGGYVLPSPSAE